MRHECMFAKHTERLSGRLANIDAYLSIRVSLALEFQKDRKACPEFGLLFVLLIVTGYIESNPVVGSKDAKRYIGCCVVAGIWIVYLDWLRWLRGPPISTTASAVKPGDKFTIAMPNRPNCATGWNGVVIGADGGWNAGDDCAISFMLYSCEQAYESDGTPYCYCGAFVTNTWGPGCGEIDMEDYGGRGRQ